MKRSKLLNAFFALDLWIACTIITTMIVHMLLSHDQILLITFASVCALVNAIFSSLLVIGTNSNQVVKRKQIKNIIKN